MQYIIQFSNFSLPSVLQNCTPQDSIISYIIYVLGSSSSSITRQTTVLLCSFDEEERKQILS